MLAFYTEESGRKAARWNLKRIADDEIVSVTSKLNFRRLTSAIVDVPHH